MADAASAGSAAGAGGAKTLSVLQEKYDGLRARFEQMDSALIAFSAGVDSTVLLKVAAEALGDKVAAVTARSCFEPQREIDGAQEFCEDEGIRHFVVDIDPLAIEGVTSNPPDRCYLCKRELFRRFKEIAAEHGYAHVCDGSNASDQGEYRPGRRAIEELGVESPLLELGFEKDEVRVLGMSLGIPNWSKPPFSCLATRFATGSTITSEALAMVDRAEQLLFDAQFDQVRVRMHEVGSGRYLARVEVGADEMDDLYELASDTDFVQQMHKMGFEFVTFDLDGYRAGSANLL